MAAEYQVQTDLSALSSTRFATITFHGFNSHNHIVVTEVGEGTSVVEVEMTQDAMNPLGMAHGGLIFTLCAMWRPALPRAPAGASP